MLDHLSDIENIRLRGAHRERFKALAQEKIQLWLGTIDLNHLNQSLDEFIQAALFAIIKN